MPSELNLAHPVSQSIYASVVIRKKLNTRQLNPTTWKVQIPLVWLL